VTIAFRDGDVAALFADMGVPVTIGGTSGLALITPGDQIIVTSRGGQGEVVGGVTTLTIQTSKFPAITNGMAVVTPDGNFTIRQQLAEPDAAQSKFWLGSV
jgi:hypothetical protein